MDSPYQQQRVPISNESNEQRLSLSRDVSEFEEKHKRLAVYYGPSKDIKRALESNQLLLAGLKQQLADLKDQVEEAERTSTELRKKFKKTVKVEENLEVLKEWVAMNSHGNREPGNKPTLSYICTLLSSSMFVHLSQQTHRSQRPEQWKVSLTSFLPMT